MWPLKLNIIHLNSAWQTQNIENAISPMAITMSIGNVFTIHHNACSELKSTHWAHCRCCWISRNKFKIHKLIDTFPVSSVRIARKCILLYGFCGAMITSVRPVIEPLFQLSVAKSTDVLECGSANNSAWLAEIYWGTTKSDEAAKLAKERCKNGFFSVTPK